MEQDALIGFADLKQGANFSGAYPFDVPHDKYLPQSRRKPFDRLLQKRDTLLGEQQLFRRLLIPIVWRDGPVIDPESRTLEPGWVNSRFFRVVVTCSDI